MENALLLLTNVFLVLAGCLAKTTALATLEQRESSEPMLEDKLILRGLKFYGFHGVRPEEKKLGHTFIVDLDVWLNLKPAIKSDNLADTVSYAETFRLVKKIVEGPPKNLVETVADLIASQMLETFPKINVIRVKLGTPNPTLLECTDYAGAEIFRKRKH
ncbi:PREDICTED: probable dihydroneopterin aldolase 3 [Camelina sativa]|uniref:7,8-dihydroneopterin aldolase n=1 Tax=Camelina sativa TaxID=90675 RepID=A0ABM0Z523_CAMSA|nr:PREDICTED: probable dihydroneopterin aldolase 3 [Camelina sativa]